MANRTVFLSSTRKDLLPYIDAVDEALRAQPELKLTPARNEYWGARPEAPAVASQVEVDRADLFVGIYGWRYGYVPRKATISITEQELARAVEKEKPIFCFVVEDSEPPPVGLPEEPEESRRRLGDLKARLLEDFVVARFTNPDDLARRVVEALHNDAVIEALLTPERRVLRGLWKTVHSSWIQGVLRRTVPTERWIAIGREERPEAVGRVAPPRHAAAAADQPIRELFQNADCKLLVLGGPAAGKTTELLELASEQGKLAWGSPDAPIPVVFHLGSFEQLGAAASSDPAAPLENWMAEQLHQLFGVGKTADAAAWLAGNKILPLLDALDEVPADSRKECAAAIDGYLEARGNETDMAVCCQERVYKEGWLRLARLLGAIALLPLTAEQVDTHLAACGEDLAGLRAAVAGSPELERLASSPLRLRRLEEIYYGRPAGEVEVRSSEDLSAAWVRHALEPQVPWLIEERPTRKRKFWRRRRQKRERSDALPRPPYAPASARRALAWLARNMIAHRRPLFQVERLQPSWLGGSRQLWAYALASRAAGGALLALPLVLFFSSAGLAIHLVVFGLLGGAAAGAIDAVALQRRPRRAAAQKRWRRYGRGAVRTILMTACVALIVLLCGLFWLRLVPSGVGRAEADAENLRLAAALLAPLLGAVYGSRAAARDRSHDVRFYSAFVWKRWSWRGVRLGAISGAVAGAAVALIGWLNPTLSHLTPALWLVLPPVFALAGALGGGTLGALGVQPLERKLRPNRGTWVALRNAGVIAFCIAVIVALLCMVFFGIFGGGTFIAALTAGAILGYWAGLGFSGLDFLQHFVLRCLLWLSRSVPGGFVGFLDYATDRGLLKKSGGSYQIYDLDLQRYLVESSKKELRPTQHAR